MAIKNLDFKTEDVKNLWNAGWGENFKKSQGINPKINFQELFFKTALHTTLGTQTKLGVYIRDRFSGKARSFSNLIVQILGIDETDKKDPIKLETAILTALGETVKKVDSVLRTPVNKNLDIEDLTTEEITYLWNYTDWPKKILETMIEERSGFKIAIFSSISRISVINEDDDKKLEKLKRFSDNLRNSNDTLFNKLVKLFGTGGKIGDIITALFNDPQNSDNFINEVKKTGIIIRNLLVISTEYMG